MGCGAATGAGAGFAAATGVAGAVCLAGAFLATAFLATFFATVFFTAVFFAAAFLTAVLRAGFFGFSEGGRSKSSSVVFLLIRLSLWGKGSGCSESVLGKGINGDVKMHSVPW